MDLLLVTPALKPFLDTILGIFRSFRDERDRKLEFWLNAVLEPLNAAMGDVHQIYVQAFHEAFLLSIKDDANIPELLEFLRDRHRETLSTRDDLQALRRATRPLEGQPPSVRDYLAACESYFGDATGEGVSTPLRAVLETLERRDDVKGMSIAEVENITPHSIRRCLKSEIAEGFACTKNKLNRSRLHILEKYHAARLEMLRP